MTGTDVTDPQVTLDAAGLAGVAGIRAFVSTGADFRDCAEAEPKVTCELPSAPNLLAVVVVIIDYADGAAAGASGQLGYTVSAENAPATTKQAKVVLTSDAGGLDLRVTSELVDDLPAKIGDVVHGPISFINEGTLAVDQVVITINLEYGLLPQEYSNCRVAADWLTPRLVQCLVDGPFAPGQEYELVDGFEATVAPDAGGFEAIEYFIEAQLDASPLPTAASMRAGTGGTPLRFAPKAAPRSMTVLPSEVNTQDNFGLTAWQVPNSRDHESFGDTASGAVGASAEITIGIRNNGASASDGSRVGDPVFFHFLIPPGTEITAAPEHCEGWTIDGDPLGFGQPGGDVYTCYGPDLLFAVGEVVDADFTLKITQVITNATGEVRRDDPRAEPPGYRDDNNTNNVGKVVVNPSAGSGGSLPITGVQVGMIAGAGALILLAGAALIVASRRRRVVLVADDPTTGTEA